MGKKSILLTILLLLFTFYYILDPVVKNWEKFSEKFDPKLYEKKYLQSQWVIPGSKNPISDEELYTYAGYKYINGTNPILINAETPHLGKYLIGISILIFKNQRIISLIIAILSLAVIGHILYESTKSLLVSSMAIFLTSSQTLFIDQIIHSPQLDIFQLFFFLLFIIFFLLYQKKGKILFLLSAGICMGYFISTKFFLISIILMNTFLLIFYFFNRNNRFKSLLQLLLLNFFSILIYIFTYSVYFLYGGSLRSFMGVQKWIYLFYRASQIKMTNLFGNYLSLIFFNRWRFWTEGYPIISYQYWNILWPIIFVLGIFALSKLLKSKTNPTEKLLINLLFGFLLVYNIFLFLTPIFPRYLLLLFVPLNILTAIYFGKRLERKFNEN